MGCQGFFGALQQALFFRGSNKKNGQINQRFIMCDLAGADA
jgi:hypothetical protein